MSRDGSESEVAPALRSAGRIVLFVGAGLVMLAASRTAAFAATADRNHNKIPDGWERKYHLSTVANRANLDPDRDGLSNVNEYRAGTSPWAKDTNHDGVKDGGEDRDKDGLVNLAEVRAHTNIRVADTDHNGVVDSLEDADHDGLDNQEEYRVGTNPRAADTDHDGVNDNGEDADNDGVDNEQEFQEGTNPRNGDSDHDGIKDGAEIRGTITSFDAGTGVLTVTSRRRHQSVVSTVTVGGATALAWKIDDDEDWIPLAAPTLADLVVGVRVHDISVTPQGDGSLLATRILLRAEEVDGDAEED